MGTASVRSGSHPGILKTVAFGSVQATVYMTGNAVGVSLSPLPRFFAAEFLAEIFGVEPRSKNLLSVFRTLRTLLSFGVVGSAVTLRLLLSPSGLYRGPFIARLRNQIYNKRAGGCKFFSSL
jgi:hypothetical protein